MSHAQRNLQAIREGALEPDIPEDLRNRLRERAKELEAEVKAKQEGDAW